MATSPPRSAAALVGLMCAAEVLAMQGFGAFAALLPELRVLWGLSYASAGWVEGAFQAGYLISVPLLVTLTDRVDARRIFVAAALIGGLASLGFAAFAEGLWSACLFRAVAGVGLAGTFMPGLRLLSDRIEGAGQSRAIAFYTASFSVGASLSVFLAGVIAARYGWRTAFAIPAGGAIVAAAIAASLERRGVAANAAGRLLDLRPALRNADALSYNLAYACHMWELYGFRAWLVAFLAFCTARAPASLWGLTPATAAAAVLMLGLPASVLGNELALRRGRRPVIAGIMLTSALASLFVGASALLPMIATLAVCSLYSMTVSAESASLTAGAVAAAAPGHRGATMAVHTLLGFAAATVGPLAFGIALDLIGGERWLAWAVGFALLGAGPALGPLLLKRTAGPTPA
jgi:MFS family permease